ncbi:PucR family transcriptional regulator [Streptomyces caeni]|uniref:PucR family transcriptional regulator n=1 Tax=Streptomyces caeni TaxID=2307231 RepID=A0ABW4IWX1_9ACTN
MRQTLVDQFAAISRDKRRLREEEAGRLRACASAAAERGLALRVLVAECLGAVCGAWPEMPGARQARDRAELESVAAAVMQAVGEAAVALTEGYETAQRAAIRREEAARREFVDALLEGDSDLGRLAERAEHFGLHLVGPHTVAVARATGHTFGAGGPAVRYVEEAMTARFRARDVLITTKEGLLVCVAPASRAEAPGWFAEQVASAVGAPYRVAVSRPRPGPSGIVHSYQEVRGILDVAGRLALPTPLVDASDLLVFQVLGRDRAAITDLVATVLGGLEDARGGPQPLIDTLTSYFASGCVNTLTARRLRLSVRTVTYRLARVRELTGYNPCDPAHRYTLQTAVLGARLLDWPATALQTAD